MNNKIRYGLAGFFILLIVVSGIFIYKNGKDLFTSKVTITYPDGCVEEFENNELVTEMCSEGRAIAKEQKERQNRQTQFDFNNI